MEDITKTGPVGLKGLKAETNKEKSQARKAYELIKAMSEKKVDPYSTFNYIDDVGLELYESGAGESKYDEGIQYNQLNNIGDIRAHEQSSISKVTNGLAKGAILAGTTFLDGTVGLVMGGMQAINEGRWSALWDNDFSKMMQSVNEWSEEAIPNYYSDYEKTAPWYENIFTANFLGDKFIKNLGFTVGAFYSGGLYAGAAKGIGKLAMTSAKKLGAGISALKSISNASSISASAFGAITSAVNEGRIEALNNSKEWYDYQKMLIDNNYQSQLQNIEAYKGTTKYNSLLYKATSDYEDTLAKLSEDRLKMGNADLLINIPILMASNVIQFGKLYANGFNTAKKNINIIKNNNKYSSGSTKFGATINTIKGAASEGFEELSQRAASEISGDYYATDVNNFYVSKTDPSASNEVLDWTKSIARGINNTVNNGSSWEEFFIGTLTGALGMPSFRSIRNEQGKLRSPITIEGGAWGEIQEYRQRKRREEEVVNYMNNRINSPEFTNYYQGLVRHQKYQNDMDIALQDGNEFNYKNAEHAQLVSDIIMFDEANKLEDLKTTVKEASGTSQKDLESIIINTTTEKNGKLVGPFAQYASKDENNQIVANLDNEESRQDVSSKIESNKNSILKVIDDYQKTKDSITLSVGDKLNDEQLSELTWMKTQINDWNKRSESIVTNDIFPLIDKLIEKESTRFIIYDTKGIPGIEESDLINTINTLKELKAKKPSDIPYILYKNPKLANLLKENAEYQNILSGNQEFLNTVNSIEDILKIVKASDLYNSKFKEYINTPEKLVDDNIESKEKQNKKAEQKVIENKITQINNNSVSNILQQSDSGEIDLNELDSILSNITESTENVIEAKSKIEEVKSINNTHRRLTSSGGIIDEIAGKNSEKQKAAKNAKILLSNSKSKAESMEEFLDIDREAFLDPTLLYDEEIYKELSGNTKDIQEALSNDLDSARSLIQQAKQLLNDENLSLDNIPSSQEGGVVRTLGNTGHDSTTSTVPVNNTNITNEDVSPYQFVTPSISTENFEKQKEDSESAEKQSSKDLGNYWKPTITQFPIHRIAGDDRPFHQILRDSNYKHTYHVGNNIYHTVTYSKEEVDKMEKVYNYLQSKGAFSIVNSGQIQPGEEITFFTDKTLNEEVGEVVILIKDSKNRVIGNLTYENAKFNGYQTSLKAFRDEFIKEYEAFNATNETEETIFEYGKSAVAKNMIGKPQYTSSENRLPLNKIFSKGFKLGIAMTSGKNANIVVSPGRKKAQGQTKFERAILSPIDSVAGQSFVLLPTSRKQNGEVVNLTVPFLMAPYSEATINTQLGTEIENVVKSFANIKTDKQAASAKFALQELLTLPDLHINLVNDDLVISLVAPDEVKQTIIYKGNPTDSNMVSKVISSLTSMNIPFQISRKYINTTFNNKDYNSMIGEIAETNLPANTESTINDWFTINPISGGKEIKAKSPKTIGMNPNRAIPSYQEVSIGDLQFTINSKTNEVLDFEGRPYNGKFANHARAKAHAIKINAKQDSVVKTDWGYYDLATDDFITDEQELQDTSNFIKERTLINNDLSNKPTSKTLTPSRSLTNTKEKKAVFEALNTEQQNLLISKSPAKQRSLMDTLVTAFDGTTFDESILGNTLDNFLTETKLRESNDESYQKWDKEKELKWIQRVLPNLSTEDRLRVVEGIEGLIPIGNTGRKAYGRFRDGIIEIGRNAARGTVYHEAFHAVTHTLLSDEERTTLFSEAKNKYGDLGNIKLEEKLAEEFRRYVQIGESGFYGVVNRIFRTIKHLVKQLFGKEAYIDNLFYRINRGKLANINYKNSPNIDRIRSYTEEELSILEKAPRDYEGHLLAPNGKPTKLSEGQYAQVRTKAFKEWFGDWTKITQNEDGTWNILTDVSKVIDSETGEPKVVYHGSPNTTFTVFDKEKIGSNTDGGFYGRGFYFSEDKGISNKYGKERKFFLNIKNPYEINPDKIGWDEADRRAHIVPNFNAKEPTPYDSELSKYDGVLQTLIENGEVLYMAEIVVPDANQIKSATDNVGTFSTESDDIRYRNADISWYEGSIEIERKELLKAINVLRKAPTINKSIKFSDGTFKQYNPSAYLTESDAVSYINKEIPADIRNAYEVRTYKGRYYIVKSQDSINNEIKRLEFITNKTISEYEREIQNIKNNSIIEASRQALEEQEVYYREIEQYHMDKYDIGRLSSEDKSYIKSRGISIEEYINMSFSEKDALFRCK